MSDEDRQHKPITEVETLALEEVRRGLEVQRTAVDEVRARTGTLLAASAVVISFLGGQALSREGWSVLSALAVLAFAGTLAAGAGVLWPVRESWRFRADATILLEDFADEDPLPAISARRHLAERLQAGSEVNKTQLQRLYLRYQVACLTLGAQAALWIILLAESDA